MVSKLKKFALVVDKNFSSLIVMAALVFLTLDRHSVFFMPLWISYITVVLLWGVGILLLLLEKKKR